ncbi:hypothetical protein DAI22_05g182800 [Oryza sativa Japonica Group]|nr:hypothetical protein DAI22_05g182800 [Oryza sativa Japonica Group]
MMRSRAVPPCGGEEISLFSVDCIVHSFKTPKKQMVPPAVTSKFIHPSLISLYPCHSTIITSGSIQAGDVNKA